MQDNIKARQERNKELLRKAKAEEPLISPLPACGWQPRGYRKPLNLKIIPSAESD